MPATKCQCLVAGFCARHRAVKTPALFDKCQTDPLFFEAWEVGRGPKQNGKQHAGGVGTELKKLISWFAWAVKATDCDLCSNREQAMNAWGPDGCEERMDRIQRWLKHSAMTHGIIYNRALSKQLILKAIATARAK